MLPADRPRYLMGVGKPIDLVEAVWRGVDMFDCVLPTRSGRHGQAWTWDGPVNLKNARFADDAEPLDADDRLPGQPRLLQGLPAPPGEVGRDPRPGAALLAQRRLLRDADGAACARRSPRAGWRPSGAASRQTPHEPLPLDARWGSGRGRGASWVATEALFSAPAPTCASRQSSRPHPTPAPAPSRGGEVISHPPPRSPRRRP